MIFLSNYGVVALAFMQGFTVFAMIFLIMYWQWQQGMVNFLHFGNELLLYLLLCIELSIAATPDHYPRQVLGDIVITLVITIVIFNLLFLV